jgi:hypothetical protein
LTLRFYTSVFLISALLFSCKKKDTTLGTDVQPSDDAVNAIYSDSATVYAHTIRYDSTRSFQDQFKYLGANQDPVFGRTDAAIFTNFSIFNNVNNTDFGNDAVLDSAEMVLVFTQSFVGDTTTPMNYQVFQLTQSPSRLVTYYMNQGLNYNPLPICNVTKRISETSSYKTIRLPIDKNFAASILNNPQYLLNNDVFQSTYKGFYIRVNPSQGLSPGQGSLMKIDLDNSVSGVYMYYHNGSSSAAKESKSYRFTFNGDNSSRFNKMNYNYLSGGNSYLTGQLSNLSVGTNTVVDNLFLKGLGGTKIVFKLPYIKNYSANEPIAVGRAEVVFKIDQNFASSINYEPPPKLSLVALDADNKEIYVKDSYYTNDLARFGGIYDPIRKEYIFNISRHLQDVMSGKVENHGFMLVVANPDPIYVVRRDDRAERVVFGGINHPNYATDFRITYVRFPYEN